MNRNSRLTWLLSAGALIVLIITVWNSVETQNQDLKKVVQQEDIYCISAICLSDDSVIKCLELDSSISHLIITGDPQVKDANRLIIQPTSTSCGRSSIIRDRGFAPVPVPLGTKSEDTVEP